MTGSSLSMSARAWATSILVLFLGVSLRSRTTLDTARFSRLAW